MSMMGDGVEQREGRGRGSEMDEQRTAADPSGSGSGSSMRDADVLEPTDITAPFRSSDSQVLPPAIQVLVDLHHARTILPKQCASTLLREISAPVELVWTIASKFDEPQKYKLFVTDCTMVKGDGGPGSIRQVTVMTGMLRTTSIERLEDLNHDDHVTKFSIIGGGHRLGKFSIIGGGHRLGKYHSVLSVHNWIVNDRQGVLVIESFVANVPDENTPEETLLFLNNIVRTNLKNLMTVAEKVVKLRGIQLAEVDSTDEATN